MKKVTSVIVPVIKNITIIVVSNKIALVKGGITPKGTLLVQVNREDGGKVYLSFKTPSELTRGYGVDAPIVKKIDEAL